MKTIERNRTRIVSVALSLIALGCIAAAPAESTAPPKWLEATAYVVPKETATEGEGYFSIIEGLNRRLYVGTHANAVNSWLVEFDPAAARMKIVVDAHQAIGKDLRGFGAQSKITTERSLLGSPAYMSPEQLRSATAVDARADIWSCGIILYELLTAEMPFFGDNVGAVFAAILETDVAPPSSRSSGLPSGLDAIILRCLRRDPAERFASALDLAVALAPYASDHGRAVAASIAGREFSAACTAPRIARTPLTPSPGGSSRAGGGRRWSVRRSYHRPT